MSTCGSGTQIQPGKAEMRNGIGDGEAGRDSCACGCHVNPGTESEEDSIFFLCIAGVAAWMGAWVFMSSQKMGGYSVGIK